MSDRMFTVYPAIDLKGGRVVRLQQGRSDAETVYGDDPAAVARQWASDGARFLHVVDLDGAFGGEPKNWDGVKAILGAVKIPVQLGGALRTREQVEGALAMGVRRVVLGTKACESEEFVGELVMKFGDRIVVGIDARDGFVTVQGWTQGGVRYQFSTEVNVRLSLASLPMLELFEDETGQAIDYRPCGYLIFTSRPEDLTVFKNNVALQNQLGVATELWSGEQVRACLPLMRLEDAIGATFHARDGLVDPNSVVMGYVAAASRLSATALTGVAVTGIQVAQDKVAAWRRRRGRYQHLSW